MQQRFFSDEQRIQRLPFKYKNKIKILKAPLCSNAMGETNANMIFEQLTKELCDANWTATHSLPVFDNSTYSAKKMTDPDELIMDNIACHKNYGRTKFVPFKAEKTIEDRKYIGVSFKTQRAGETAESLIKELHMQEFLGLDPKFQSCFPKPLDAICDDKSISSISFMAPEGYYDYLSEIDDTKQFTIAACKSAHDLGYLLRHYRLVFPGLVSIFHADQRPYTLLPNLTRAAKINFGGLPGKIEQVIGKKLYENMGICGLRDIGDLVCIDDYQLQVPAHDGKLTLKDLSLSLKIAHFISLYLMVFTLLIGNRSKMLEQKEIENAWLDNDRIYSQILSSLFDGLNLELTPETLAYVDLSLLKSSQKPIMQAAEKFNRQLYFCFTNHKNSLFGTSQIIHEQEVHYLPILHEYYGTKKVTFFCGDERDSITDYRYFYYGSLNLEIAKYDLKPEHSDEIKKILAKLNEIEEAKVNADFNHIPNKLENAMISTIRSCH
jgi:hypothetical protein